MLTVTRGRRRRGHLVHRRTGLRHHSLEHSHHSTALRPRLSEAPGPEQQLRRFRAKHQEAQEDADLAPPVQRRDIWERCRQVGLEGQPSPANESKGQRQSISHCGGEQYARHRHKQSLGGERDAREPILATRSLATIPATARCRVGCFLPSVEYQCPRPLPLLNLRRC